MGQFKPMVKMYTNEPSVILKLKKGGKVKAAGHDDGFKSMSESAGGNPFDAAEKGKAPKKPSMADRRKAMNPNMYAKGGKVAHKQMGGVMPGAMAGPAGAGAMAPAAAPMAPMGRAAVGRMSPAERARRAAAIRRVLMGMKKGGSTTAECAKLERELKHHESMPASKAHGKASGGKIDSAETKTTLKNSVKPYAKTKMDTAKKDTAHGTGEVKEGKPGGYAMGGSIMGNEAAYENTKMVTAGKGKTNGTTGGVRMGNAGGYKHGGKAIKKASGGAIDAKMTRTTVEGGNWENRPANTSKPGKSNTTTGEVRNGNAGGYKHGGHASKKHYATGGNVVDDGKAVKMPKHFVSPPVANSLQSGTFKRGGKVGGYAEGGSSDDDPSFSARKLYTQTYAKYGKTLAQSKNAESKAYEAVAKQHGQNMLKKLQAFHKKNEQGYANGGKVMKYASGDAVENDPGIARENRRRDAEREAQKAENIGMRESILGAPRRAFEAIKGMMSPDKAASPGSVTKTEKSVTVTPSRKRGGKVC